MKQNDSLLRQACTSSEKQKKSCGWLLTNRKHGSKKSNVKSSTLILVHRTLTKGISTKQDKSKQLDDSTSDSRNTLNLP
uniref:Uncharacterized protein n=1 Tax=Utricularia reniformis TaxID=192314 RepID=A0A1Y0B2V7_9LAMI|nr:hypothetical protein AEK19_MT1603 [Utricularia reniformis]ART31785.1 hypothetical protein AEK19_MT1603 [Utricularia reniformis]